MILLDTNVVFWSLVNDELVGSTARSRMNSTSCYISSISIVEFRIKEMKGKLQMPDRISERVTALGFHLIDFGPRHADALKDFPELVGNDPFDRMLLAQASVDGLEFLTSDRALKALDKPWIIDATQ